MKCFFALLFALLSFSALSQQDQKLANGKWAYYGEEFYIHLAQNSKVDRSLLFKVLNDLHSSVKGKFDTISEQCVKNSSCYGHTSVGYTTARKIMFGELDVQRDTKGTYVLDVYCGKKFYYRNLDDVSGMHTEVNIEHTWPQSKFTSAFPKDQQKSDMHHLYLTDSKANSARGNSPFGFLESFKNRSAAEGCGGSRFGLSGNGDVYTPPVSHRGNVARALFYFSAHYNMPISQREETILRQWHDSDPVDAEEIRRHEGIAKHQKVRNPFVDHPELVKKMTDF